MSEASGGIEEERVGRVTVRATSRPSQQDYRVPALVSVLEIERGALPRRLSRAQIVATLVALFLTLGIGVLGAFMGLAPVMGVAPVPLVALMVGAFIHFRETNRMIVRVGKNELAASAIGPHKRIPLERVEGIGAGIDHHHRTVWIRVRDEGRLPLLDGLSQEEAELASRRLREVLEPAS